MDRTVVTLKDTQQPGFAPVTGRQATPDGYGARLIKYIPPDVLAAYTAAVTAAKQMGYGGQQFQLYLFLVFVVVTFLYLRFVAKIAKWWQVVIGTVALIIYVAAQSDGALNPYIPAIYGVIALIIYVLFIPNVKVDA